MLITANNRIVPESQVATIPVTHTPDNGYRAQRISDLLARHTGAFSLDDFSAIQGDRLDLPARDTLAPAYLAVANRTPALAPAAKILSGWDGQVTASSAAAALYEETTTRLIQRTVADTVDADSLAAYLGDQPGSATSPILAIANLVKTPRAPFFGSTINSDATERAQHRDKAIADALTKALASLTKQMGSDTTKWSWGALHQYAPTHPLATVPVIGALYGIPTSPLGGDSVTVNNASIDLALGAPLGGPFDYTAQYAPAARLLLDVGSPDHSRSQMPLGESGNPRSRHFDDQIARYIANQTDQLTPLSPAAIAALPKATRLILRP